MKVCQITSVHPNDDIRIFVKECSSLAKAGVDVTLIANNDRNETRNGVHIKALKKRNSAIKRILFNLPIILIFCLRKRFDVYHGHDPELIPVLFILRCFGKKVVYDMHENFPKQLASKELPSYVKKIVGGIWPIIERICLRRMSVVFAESSYKEDYPYVKSSVDILNMPLVTHLSDMEVNKKDIFTLGYVGGVSQDRYCLRILETVLSLQQSGYRIGFDCVGPIESASTEAKINELLGQLENVRFYGELPPNAAWSIISKCHVGIAMLMPKPNYVGSYPTKLFEYIALGMPVLTSNFELYKPVVEGNNVGYCIDPLQPEIFEEKVIELYKNKEQYDALCNNTNGILEEKYNWENEVSKLQSFYAGLLK